MKSQIHSDQNKNKLTDNNHLHQFDQMYKNKYHQLNKPSMNLITVFVNSMIEFLSQNLTLKK